MKYMKNYIWYKNQKTVVYITNIIIIYWNENRTNIMLSKIGRKYDIYNVNYYTIYMV